MISRVRAQNYVRNVHQKLKIVFLCPKFSRDDVQRALMSLIVKHVLDLIVQRDWIQKVECFACWFRLSP